MKGLSKTGIFAAVLAAMFVLVALFTPWIANDPEKVAFTLIEFGPETVDIFESKFLASPDSTHLMGTDYVGRDVFSRLVHGTRNSLFFAMAVVAFCIISGMILGGIMGFFGGWVDLALSRVMELIANLPVFLLQLTILAFLPRSYFILFFIMIIVGWIPYCRFTRGEFLKLRKQEFVTAGTAIGAGRIRLFFRHLLPNSLTPSLIYIPFDLSMTIATLGALSFLGFGEPINVASIGELLKQAQSHFQKAPWLAIYPGATLFFLTFSLALLSSSVRKALDPRSSQK